MPIGMNKVSRSSKKPIVIPDSEDLHARYDATALSLSDGQSVSTWGDETGNGYALTAGTAPTYKTGVINGNPVVRYDGVGDFLSVDWTALSQPNHIFLVAQIGGDDGYFDSFEDDNERHLFDINSGEYRMLTGTLLGGGSPDTNWNILNTLYDGSGSELRVNGSSVMTGDVGGQPFGGITVGGNFDQSQFFDVDVGEILVYPQDKSAVQSDVESYLSDKWGITLS